MPYIQGFLIEGGVDNTLPRPPGHADNALPGGGGGYIDNSLPPPPGLWPPPASVWPPIALPPNYPMPPGSIWPPVRPPHAGQPLPPSPGHPDAGLPVQPGHPDAGLPIQPGHPDQGLPSQKFLVAIVAASAAGGLKVVGYTVVDPSLDVGMPLPGNQPGIDNSLPGGPPGGIAGQPLPPTAQPR